MTSKREDDKKSVTPPSENGPETPSDTVVEFGAKAPQLTINAFAEEARVDATTITRRIRLARIEPSGKRGKSLTYRLSDLLRCAYLMDDEGNFNPSGLDPFKRKAHFQAAQEEVRYRAECGELIPKIQVEECFADAMKIAARFFDTLVDVLERDCGVSRAQLLAIDDRLDKMREEFYQALVVDDDDASSDQQSPVRAGE